MNFPHIKQHFPVSEIIEQYRGGEYSAELLLQHLLKHIMENQNELLEAALKVVETMRTVGDNCEIDWSLEAERAMQTIERHRPKPERLEGWVNVFKDGRIGQLWSSQEIAAVQADEDCPPIRQALLREVVPVEFEKWTAESAPGGSWWRVLNSEGGTIATNLSKTCAESFRDTHNTEMERIANA
jgi:hypothetical protein